jgi:hypothetical protein
VVTATGNGFHWGDAGIGAAAAIGLIVSMLALLSLIRNHRQSRPAQ